VITFNYRGSWGSPGSYSFAHDLADVDAVLAYARAPENAAKLGLDPKRIVLGGHSLGGWATALTAAHDAGLAGAFMISPGNLGRFGKLPRDRAIAALRDNGMESLATTPEAMADELIAKGDAYDFVQTAPRLAKTRLLVLTSDDGGGCAGGRNQGEGREGRDDCPCNNRPQLVRRAGAADERSDRVAAGFAVRADAEPHRCRTT
jgi:uncharacterized protein